MYNLYKDIYTEKLVTYNIDVKSIKSKFIKSLSLEDYKKLLAILDFNTERFSDNYRWGKRYFDKNKGQFNWTTTSPQQKVTEVRWNNDEKRYKEYSFIPEVSDKELTQHYSSSVGKNIKFKFPVTYSLDEQYVDGAVNIQKIHNKTFGLAQKTVSDILWLDIDNRNGYTATTELIKIMDILGISIKNIYYMEQNLFTGGLHVFIGLNRNISNNNVFTELEKKLNSENIQVECNFKNGILRLPLSTEYMPINLTNNLDLSTEKIDQKFYMSNSNQLFRNENIFKPLDVQNILDYINNKEVKKVNTWNNYWKTSRNLFVRTINNKEKKVKKVYSIKAGQRWNTTKKIVPYLKANGYSLFETAQAILDNNVDSKDLNNWSLNKVVKEIEAFYNKCPEPVSKCRKVDTLISNEHLLDKKSLQLLSNPMLINKLTDELSMNYIQERNRTSINQKKMSNKKKDILKKQLSIILKEILGKMIYDIQTEKRFIDKKYEHMNGFQLSDNHLNKIIDYANKKLGIDGLLSKTNIQYLKNALINLLGLKEMQSNCHNKRNWIKGSCKSYNVHYITDVYNIITNLYNKLMVHTSLFNQFISNISIGKGNNFVDETVLEQFFNKKVSVPIPIPIKNT